MVSPSKAQQQQQQPQENRSRETDRRSHVRIQKGPKPLEKNTFYLDIKNHVLSNKLEAKIKDLGGKIELFLGRSVTVVVSDRGDLKQQQQQQQGQQIGDKIKWGWHSGGSGGLPSLRSVEIQTPTQTPPTPSPAAESPLNNSTNLRGIASRPKSRADAMLERALTQPQQYSVDPLKNAQNWGIPIWATTKLQSWLDKIYASIRGTYNLKQIQQPGSVTKDPKVKHLKAPYIKFESFQRDTKPIFLELPNWPKLNFEGEPGTCPFDVKRREEKDFKISSKDIKENKKGSIHKQLDKDKDMTRRPRGGATRTRRTEQLVAGYCEICRIDYRDLKKHVRSDQHLNFVRNDDNFLSLDTLINAGASVEAFLNFNRSKEISKDCSLFPTVGRSLRSVVLPEEKVENSAKPELDNYNNTGNIEMVQCNGARSNIDLKLNSSHNLRTRAKHESGHLLRSKGSPWHEVDKSDKFYDKFEGFTIKKRAKGTIWIEEDEPDDNKCLNNEDDSFKVNNKNQQHGFDNDTVSTNSLDTKNGNKNFQNPNTNANGKQTINFKDIKCEINQVYELSCIAKATAAGTEILEGREKLGQKTRDDNNRIVENENDNIVEKSSSEDREKEKEDISVDNEEEEEELRIEDRNSNCFKEPTTEDRIQRCSKSFKTTTNQINNEKLQIDSSNRLKLNGSSSGNNVNEVQNECKEELKGNSNSNSNSNLVDNKIINKEDDSRVVKTSRRGGRTSRGRNRLSVEERLIEDNRAYYKVEVLGSKLRSSTIPSAQNHTSIKCAADDEERKKEDSPSSEKPVVVRFKRVRKSELSLLSDEAESFMFGELKRDETSDCSESDQQNSVLPNDTESDRDLTSSSFPLHSSVNDSNSSLCDDNLEDDSQDSVSLGRARKRRRTQAEALIKDNEDYYKFQTPGSRLRYQAPITGVKESEQQQQQQQAALLSNEIKETETEIDNLEKFFSSKPSPEVEKLQFSFEAVPKSEPWYQTYQRQDEGAEFWHCFSEGDNEKPFLLPYEIENFHETLTRSFNNKGESNRKRGRGRRGGGVGRSPRKSPRCHASTLAIMSTIIRKREQFQSPNLSIIEEETQSVRSRTNTPTTRQETTTITTKYEIKSEIDEDLKEIARNIDDMLCGKNIIGLEDSFETELSPSIELGMVHPHIPKGPPPDLLDLLDNCRDINCLDNSSCASSECGETTSVESPMKRRKRRKNRTGWPGIKMRKKLQAKQSVDQDCERENINDSKIAERLSEMLNIETVSSGRLHGDSDCRISESNDSNGLIIQSGIIEDERNTDDYIDRIKCGKSTDNDCSSSRITPSQSNFKNVEITSKRNNRSLEETGKSLSKNTDNLLMGIKSERNFDKSDMNGSAKMSKDLSDVDNKNVENNEYSKCTVSKKQRTNSTSRKYRRRSTSASSFQDCNNSEDDLYRKDSQNSTTTTMLRKQGNSNNVVSRKNQQQRESDVSSSDIQQQESDDVEDEMNRFNTICRKDAQSNTNTNSSRNQQTSNNSLSKRQRGGAGCKELSSETHSSDINIEENMENSSSVNSVLQKQSNSNSLSNKKRQRGEDSTTTTTTTTTTSSSDVVQTSDDFEDENLCKKDTNLNITSRKQQQQQQSNSRKRQRRDTMSSEANRDSEIEFTFSVSQSRVSPVVTNVNVELENRRSSIEFQPVVRMTKIDEQVDIDNGVLSVTVASNRRLRSSTSPRSNLQPPAKRFRNSKGKFGRWIKNS